MFIHTLDELFCHLFLLCLLASTAHQNPVYSFDRATSDTSQYQQIYTAGQNQEAPYKIETVVEERHSEEVQVKILADISPNANDHQPCSSCQKGTLSESALAELYINYTKQRILQKLALTEPPTLDEANIRPLPPEALRMLEQERRRQEDLANAKEQSSAEEQDFYSKTTDITVISEVGK